MVTKVLQTNKTISLQTESTETSYWTDKLSNLRMVLHRNTHKKLRQTMLGIMKTNGSHSGKKNENTWNEN